MLALLTNKFSELWTCPDNGSVFKISGHPTLDEIECHLEKLRANPTIKSFEVIDVDAWERGIGGKVLICNRINFHHFFSLSNLCRLPYLTKFTLKAITVTDSLLTDICMRYPSITELVLDRCELALFCLFIPLLKLDKVVTVRVRNCFTKNNLNSVWPFPYLMPPMSTECLEIVNFKYLLRQPADQNHFPYELASIPSAHLLPNECFEHGLANLQSLTMNIKMTPEAVARVVKCVKKMPLLCVFDLTIQSFHSEEVLAFFKHSANIDPIMEMLADPDILLSDVTIRAPYIETIPKVSLPIWQRMFETNTNLYSIKVISGSRLGFMPDGFISSCKVIAKHPTLVHVGLFHSYSVESLPPQYHKAYYQIFETNNRLLTMSSEVIDNDIFEPIAARNRKLQPSLYDRLLDVCDLEAPDFTVDPPFKIFRGF